MFEQYSSDLPPSGPSHRGLIKKRNSLATRSAEGTPVHAEWERSPHPLALGHLPQSQVQHFKAWELRDPLQAPLGDLGAAVQVDARQLGQVVGDQLQALVRDPAALSDVERFELVHLPHHPVDAVVADVAGAERQRLQLVQALRDVGQALVPDLVAEGHVQPGQPERAHGQVHDPGVADVVARAQIQAAEVGHVRQVDHPDV